MSSIFTGTMIEAIRKYRAMLRKYLPQAERVNLLHSLNLKNPQLYHNEILLYETGYKIVEHLHLLDSTKNGYYSYSGISQFAGHLQKFLEKYKIDENRERVLHTSQEASRNMVRAMQILAIMETTPGEGEMELRDCHEKIIHYGSREQLELYRTSLQNLTRKHIHDHNGVYRNVLQQFMQSLEEKASAA
jgi:hypothetical protein